MENHTTSSATIKPYPRWLWFITLTYSMLVILTSWFNPYLVLIYKLSMSAGMLSAPLTFLTAGLITEVYGYKYARRAIWGAFLFNTGLIIYGQMVTHLPSPAYAVNNSQFDTLLMFNTKIILAFVISYFSSEPLNCFFLAKLKVVWKGQYMAIRFALSILSAASINSIAYSLISVTTILNHRHLLTAIFVTWLIVIMFLPLLVCLAKNLKTIEKINIYDIETNFSLFSLDTTYIKEDDKFNNFMVYK